MPFLFSVIMKKTYASLLNLLKNEKPNFFPKLPSKNAEKETVKISEQNLLQSSVDLLISVEESAGSDVMRTVSQRFERSAVLSPFSEAVSVPEFEDNTNL